MSRRKKPTAQSVYIWGQLERISKACNGAPKSRDQSGARAAWQKFWQETVAGDKLSTVDVDDVARILGWGWVLEMTAGNYSAATEILLPYFAHPQIEYADPISTTSLRCDLATGTLCAGDEEKTMTIYRSLLESENKQTARIGLLNIRNRLAHLCSERGIGELASVALRDLVEEIVNRLKRRVPLKKRLPEEATYADLHRLLESTYPPKIRARLQSKQSPEDGT